MKGIINETFYVAYATQEEMDAKYIDTPEIAFDKGDEVEILKEITTGGWVGGKAYIIYNNKTKESMTLSSIFVDKVEK